MVKRLDKHISDGKVNGYYETVFAEMIADGKPWYEIDTIADLAIAEKLFSSENYRTPKKVTPSQPDFLRVPLTNATMAF
ncbi:MAG: hypothetical protein R8K46_08455 [Mariprofundaceae bacterium]